MVGPEFGLQVRISDTCLCKRVAEVSRQGCKPQRTCRVKPVAQKRSGYWGGRQTFGREEVIIDSSLVMKKTALSNHALFSVIDARMVRFSSGTCRGVYRRDYRYADGQRGYSTAYFCDQRTGNGGTSTAGRGLNTSASPTRSGAAHP